MEAKQKTILQLLESYEKKFIIPVYQRNYEWGKDNCDKLYQDLIDISKYNRKSHFLGSVVISCNSLIHNQTFFVIDGQQRITTITLLLLAMHNIILEFIDKNYFDEDEIGKKSMSLIAQQIKEEYLINKYEQEEKRIKLKPIKSDNDAFVKLFNRNNKEDLKMDSNIINNYNFFYKKLYKNINEIEIIYNNIKKLELVEIRIDETVDDAQLIFETINSTGVDLSEADKIRNLIFMGEDEKTQNYMFENYWTKIEEKIDSSDSSMDKFIKDYLIVKTLHSPKDREIYFKFKDFLIEYKDKKIELLDEILKYAEYYHNLKTGNIATNETNNIMKNIIELDISTCNCYLLTVLNDFNEGLFLESDVKNILELLESFIFRRIICGNNSNALNKMFPTLRKEILCCMEKNKNFNYIDAFNYTITNINKNKSFKFPSNNEFKNALITSNNIYNIKKKSYIFRKLENYNSKEYVDVDKLIEEKKITIEHIMPQILSNSWKLSLGEDYYEIHNEYLNNLGNLTLTGYNSELGNKDFLYKKENGFNKSKLTLNDYVKKQNKWGKEEIIERASILASLALNIWKYPNVKDEYIKNNNIYTIAEDLNVEYKSPVNIEFYDESYDVYSWRDFARVILNKLYLIDANKFEYIYSENFNKTTSRAPYLVGNKFAIDLHGSAQSIFDMVKKFISYYDIDSNKILFTLRDK